jgi:hypothetical protein
MSMENAHGPRPEVSLPTLEIVSDETFDALVGACQLKLAKATWQHPNTFIRVPGGVTVEADDGQRARRYTTELGNLGYDLREYGGDSHQANFYVISVAVHRGDRRLASFDIDLDERHVRRIWQIERLPELKYVGSNWLTHNLEEQVQHLTKVIGRFEPLVAARSETDDAWFGLFHHPQLTAWSGRGDHGSRVVCLQRADDKENIVGIRFRGTHALIEHLFIDENGQRVHRRLEYDSDRQTCHVITTVDSLPRQPSLQTALEETSQTMFTIVRHVNNGLLVPFEAGQRRAGGFRVLDIMQHAARQTK